MEELINKASTLVEALPYLQKYRGRIFVFKYGGHAMQNEGLRESFLRDLILLKHVGIHPVVVHGGGPQIQETLKALGIEPQFANGLRVTDDRTMEIVEMVLVGKVNTELVSRIHKLGGEAVGFSGKDGRLIEAVRKEMQEVTDDEGRKSQVNLGKVGEVKRVNPRVLESLIREDLFIPVISPIGLSENGESLNINADTAACEIAKALKAAKLFLLTDVHGVMDPSGKMIVELDAEMARKLITQKVITGGMIPKVCSAVDAIEKGVGSVAVIDGQIQHAVLLEIFTDQGVGTLIRRT